MYSANCSWNAGVANVDYQLYTWSVDGNQVADGQLQPQETTRTSTQDGVTINPQDTVSFAVVSANQYGESDPATAVGTAPAPAPEAPSNVVMTFTELPAVPIRR